MIYIKYFFMFVYIKNILLFYLLLFLVSADDFAVIRESILWLESNQSPWQLVENHWKITVAYRRNQIQKSSNKTVEEIFTQWPILKHPTAHTLIEEDFTYLKLTSEDCIKNWFNFFSKIQEICPIKEEKIVSELHLLLNADDLTDGTFTKKCLYSHEIIYFLCFQTLKL